MSIYYVYANLDVTPPVVGLAKSDPPVTGGVVFWQFETDEADHHKRIKMAESLAPPLRVENDKGALVTVQRPASSVGLEEALMEAGAIARVNPSRPLRLVVGTDVVLRRWN